MILLFGGDGTIHRHLGQLVKLGLPVLVVPVGSGNDFARALGLRRVRDSLAAWEHFCRGASNIRQIDLGVISAFGKAGEAPAPHESRYFCCVAGVGLDGEVARRANRLPRWLRGNGGYVLSLLPTIFSFAPFPMKILAAGKELSTDRLDHSHRPADSAGRVREHFHVRRRDEDRSRAKMDDGLLDVCVVGGVDPFKLFCLFPTVYSGRHLSVREVEYFQATRVRVETEHPLDVYADGEYVCRTPVEIGIQPAALRVITAGI